jgi:hypothetical protein
LLLHRWNEVERDLFLELELRRCLEKDAGHVI